MLFLVAYGILATIIALNYRIIFDDRIPWDAYFSFDNRAIVMTGGGYERHPLANYFFDAIREFAFLFSKQQKNDIFRLILAYCSTIVVSLSLIQIYKYLKNIIGLSFRISVILLLFFAFFSTPILLSFTPETYTYTLFFLVLFNYYAALKLKKDKKIPAVALAFGAVSIGGLTVTNIVKVYLPTLFENKVFRSWKTFGNLMVRALVSMLIFALLVLYRLDFKFLQFINKSGEQYEKFSNPKVTPIWDMIVSWFFGGNMLMSSFITRDYHNKKGFEYKALFMDVYSSWFCYAFVFVVVLLLLWGILRNIKNKFTMILAASLLVDIIIHCVLKFGLHTSYIYGGHFIFVFPLLIGWLFHSYRNSPKMIQFLFSTIVVLMAFLIMNNAYRMGEFFTFLDLYYR